MKKALLVILLLVTSKVTAVEIIRRGDPVPARGKAVSIGKLIAAPDRYAKKPVIVEGVIVTSCTNKGCWMQLAPSANAQGVRVTFKDYGFFIPLNARGMSARAEGVAKIRTLSKKEADHLEAEGAKLRRNADGTVREISFIANGVELRRRQ